MLNFFKEKILKPTNEMLEKNGLEKIDLDKRKCEMCGEETPIELLSGIGDKEVCQDCQNKFE